jgi:Protein of unknown function (DUF433)
VGFGKPVIAGTGISTAVVASRFNARESIDDLASEYGVKPRQIEKQFAASTGRPLSLPERGRCEGWLPGLEKRETWGTRWKAECIGPSSAGLSLRE